LPETVHEVLLARIDALPADARQLLQAASVVGMEFTWPMLSAVVLGADLEQALRTLQRQDLIVVRNRELEPVLAFRHPLIHEVAYRSLLMARRREFHGRIASWLVANGGDESLPAIASHYRDSDELDEARIYLTRAADRAASLYAAREAKRFYTDAAQLFTDEPAPRARLLEQAATQAYLIADAEDAVTLISQAIELYEATDETLRALDCRRRLGRYYWLMGRGDEAEAEIARAIEALERLPPSPELALAYSYQSQIRFLMPDFAAGEAWARKAIETAERTGATAALVHAYNNLGGSLLGLGDPSGQDYLRRSLDLALEHNMADDVVRAYVNLTGQGYHIMLFPYAEQDRLLREGIAFAEQMIPGGTWHRWLQSSLGEFLFHTGRWDDAERALASPHLSRANRYVVISVAAIRALTAAHRGDYDRAAELTRPEVGAAIRNRDLLGAAPVLVALAHLEAGLGNGRAAVEAIRKLVELRGNVSEATISTWSAFEATDVVTWLAVHDDPAAPDGLTAVASLADRVAADIQRGGPPAEVAVRRALYGAAREQLQRLAGRFAAPRPLADVDAVMIPSVREAIVLLDEARRPFDAARVRLWLAEAGDSAGLAPAVDAFKQLGAAPYLARALASHTERQSLAP
jgi:tetratricopeptide (TPR) repeat protein